MTHLCSFRVSHTGIRICHWNFNQMGTECAAAEQPSTINDNNPPGHHCRPAPNLPLARAKFLVVSCGRLGAPNLDLLFTSLACFCQECEPNKTHLAARPKIVLALVVWRSQNNARLVKRKRALLESNSPGITNRELIGMMSAGVTARALWLLPHLVASWLPSRLHLLALDKLSYSSF